MRRLILTVNMNTKFAFLILLVVFTLACSERNSAPKKFIVVANNQEIEQLNFPPDAFVASDYSDLRAADNLEARVLLTIRQSTPIQILNKSGNWYLIKTRSGSEGWMHKSTLKFIDSEIKPKPSTDYYEPQPKAPPPTLKAP